MSYAKGNGARLNIGAHSARVARMDGLTDAAYNYTNDSDGYA